MAGRLPVLVGELLTLYAQVDGWRYAAAVLPRVTPYRDYLAWLAAAGSRGARRSRRLG